MPPGNNHSEMSQTIQNTGAALPSLLLSSQAAGWAGLTLEQHLFLPGERETPARAEHLICLNLGQRCALWLSQSGRTQRVMQGCGEMLLVPSGEEGQARNAVPGEVLHLLIQPALVQRTAQEMGLRRTELVGGAEIDDPRLRHLGLALREEARSGGASGPLFAESLTTALAAHLVTQYSTSAATAAHAGPRGGFSASKLRRVTEYVQDNLNSSLTLAEIAAVAGVSPFHFARQYKRATGETVHAFVLRCRVEAAARLLRRNTLSVGQVAAEVGFAQQSHLAAHFKRTMGLSPLEYRRQASV